MNPEQPLDLQLLQRRLAELAAARVSRWVTFAPAVPDAPPPSPDPAAPATGPRFDPTQEGRTVGELANANIAALRDSVAKDHALAVKFRKTAADKQAQLATATANLAALEPTADPRKRQGMQMQVEAAKKAAAKAAEQADGAAQRAADGERRLATQRLPYRSDGFSDARISGAAESMASESWRLSQVPNAEVNIDASNAGAMAATLLYGDAGSLDIRNHTSVTAGSEKKKEMVTNGTTHPVVRALLDQTPAEQRGTGHGTCAEIMLISDFLWSLNPSGEDYGLADARRDCEGRGAVTIAHSRMTKDSGTMTEACGSCAYVAGRLAIATVATEVLPTDFEPDDVDESGYDADDEHEDEDGSDDESRPAKRPRTDP